MADNRDIDIVGGGLHSFSNVISLNNLFIAWREFKRGKLKKGDVQKFYFYLEENLLKLHYDLSSGNYRHGAYDSFFIADPKRRHIHKASVRDRIVHQAVFRSLYHSFDRHFIYDSYSCRFNKGTHRAVKRLCDFSKKVTANYHNQGYVLKCDIVKFFASLDHRILLRAVYRRVSDKQLILLLKEIIGSFGKFDSKGIPLGNVTSQLFANIYLNELDRFIKHTLKSRHYIRYCDDFVILHKNQKTLNGWRNKIQIFLLSELGLSIHKDRVSIRKISSGIDFLGYVVLSHYMVVRTSTRHRMLKRVDSSNIYSYLGLCSHAKSFRIRQIILKLMAEKGQDVV